MESGVEYGNVRNRREDSPHLANSGYVDGIVQGRQGTNSLQLGKNRICYQRRLAEALTAVNNPMHDHANVAGRPNHSSLFGSKFLNEDTECVVKADRGNFSFYFPTRSFVN